MDRSHGPSVAPAPASHSVWSFEAAVDVVLLPGLNQKLIMSRAPIADICNPS
jgi:hypothetical protein